jgi:peptidoglycan/LPS O-acetylase OafA/YrhL
MEAPLGQIILVVDFFFILSGFVLASGADTELRSGALTAGESIRRRLIRVYPVYLAGLLFGAVIVFHVAPAGDVVRILAANLFFVPFTPAGWRKDHLFLLNGALWSLMWEMALSLAYGFAGRRLTGPVLAAVVTASFILLIVFAASGGINGGWARASFFEGAIRALAGFSIGLMLGCLVKAGVFHRMPEISTWILMAAFGTILLLPELGDFKGGFDILLVAVIFPLIVTAGACTAPCSQRSRKILRGLGDLAYPLYAVHIPVMLLAFAIGRTSGVPTLPPCVAGYALSLAVAYVVLVRWDVPIRRWLNGARLVEANAVKAA